MQYACEGHLVSLFTFNANFSSLVAVLERIAQCLERAIPPIPAPPLDEESVSGGASSAGADPNEGFHLAESPEEYMVRTSHEAALAEQLGVAPWSPALQTAIMEVKQDIMRKKNEEGREYTEAEADQLVRDAFQLAKAAANEVKAGR